ncbi:MAG: IS200/IS605 family transposase [Chloroflexota bacterium]
MTYWRLHYHIIWSTQGRQPLLTAENEKIFYGVLYKKEKDLGLIIHAAGNVEDHVHIVVSIPPNLSIADCVRHIKGASAHAINQGRLSEDRFHWQEGYGVLTIGDRSLSTVMAYAARQKEHHSQNKLVDIYERIEDVMG